MIDNLKAPRKRTCVFAMLFALLAIGACGDKKAETEEAAPVATEAAEGEEHEAEVVLLDSTALRISNISVASVAFTTAMGLRVTGTITYDANRVSHVGPRIDGRIVRVAADVGSRVGAGQTLAILESPQIGELRVTQREAAALLRIARENYAREQRLEQQGISSRKELLDARADLSRAEASVESAIERLRVMGATGQGSGGQYALTAPFGGIIVARDANLGEMASPSDQLFTVANLTRVWIELDIYERDLSRVRPGQSVQVTTTAYGARTFPGRIVYVGAIVDPEKRTVRARVEIPNANGALRPGMFATARIEVGGAGEPTVTVPQSAIQELEGRKVVFIQGTRAGEFLPVPIVTGETTDDGKVVVVSGLKAGDRIVVSGAFALRSELAKGEIGEHGH